LAFVAAACAPAAPPTDAACVVFVGDTSLARGVATELARTAASPWAGFPTGDPWVGNLEGTLAAGPCRSEPCLGFDEAALARLAGSPFAALSLANNHTFDHGPEGLAATVAGLRALGITPLPQAGSPHLLRLADEDFAFIPLDLSEGGAAAALEAARLQVGLARARTPWVVVLPHWGVEGEARLGPGQAATAELLRAWGATLVVGAGAHVPQGHLCAADHATWYGLGNHLFDQRPPETHEGALLRCCPIDGKLSCVETRTRRTSRSTFPSPVAGEVARCDLHPTPAERSWEVHPWRDQFKFVQSFPAAGEGAWFTLHERWSDLDGQVGLRPYVWRERGDAWEDLWRGSALALPIVSARLFDHGGTQLLCALHRGDSFLAPDPATPERVRIVYRWTGFGFREVEDVAARAACERL
jgi:poly-gamma-glutamate synthesis protein (capsule biosynthesis protein)